MAAPQTAVYNAPGESGAGKLFSLAVLALVVGGGIYAAERFDVPVLVGMLLHGYPSSAQQAQRDLMLLSRDWFIAKLHGNDWLADMLHNRAAAIRQKYGDFGHPNGYSAQELYQHGLFTADQFSKLQAAGLA